MSINEIIEHYHLNMKKFSVRFGIPYRTVQNWCNGSSQCHEWMLRLFLFALKRGYWYNSKENRENIGV